MPALQQQFIATAYRVGVSGPVAAGKVLCFTNAATNRFVVATSANLSTYGQNPACISLEAADENNPSPEVQLVGFVPASITGLGAGAAGDICVNSSGALARGSSPDVVGQCDAEGNAMVNFAGIGVGGGGGGATPGGSTGDLQVNGGAGTFAGLAPGTSGNVATSNGTAWTSAAPSVDAPVGAQYVTLATNATLTNERVLTAGSGISVTDNGAGSTVVIAATGGAFSPPTGTGFVTVTAGALDAAATTSFNVSTYTLTDTSIAQYDLLVADGTPRFKRFAKGANNTVLTTSSIGVVQYAQVSLTAMVTGTLPLGNGGTGLTAVPGSNTQLIYNNSGVYGATSGVTFPASNSLALGSTPATVGNIRFTNVSSEVARNAANSADQYIWSFSSSNILAIGSDSAYATGTMVSALRPCATASIDPVINGSFVGSWTSTTLEVRTALAVAGKVSGMASLSSPFQFKATSINVAAGGTFVLTAAQYECPYLNFTGNAGTTCHVQAPNTAEATFFYYYAGASGTLSLSDTSTAGTGVTNITTGSTSRGMVAHDGSDYVLRTRTT